MACVRKRRDRWVIDFRDDNDIRRWGSYRTRKEADHALSKALEKVRKQTYRPAAETPVFKETGTQWLANKQDRRPSTVAQWEVHLHGHLIPTFGRRRLDQITPADVEHFRDERRAAGLGAATVNKLLTTGAAVYKYAARHRLTEGNPFAVADRCRLNADEVSLIDMDNQTAEKEVSPDEVLSPEEAASLIAGAFAGFEKTLYLVAVLTGARINELLALAWPDVDLDGRKLHIRRTLSWAKLRSEKDKPPRPRFFEPKTKTSRRRLPLPPELSSELRKWKVACPLSKLNLVFPTDEGGRTLAQTHLRVVAYLAGCTTNRSRPSPRAQLAGRDPEGLLALVQEYEDHQRG
jgi:integrase